VTGIILCGDMDFLQIFLDMTNYLEKMGAREGDRESSKSGETEKGKKMYHYDEYQH